MPPQATMLSAYSVSRKPNGVTTHCDCEKAEREMVRDCHKVCLGGNW